MTKKSLLLSKRSQPRCHVRQKPLICFLSSRCTTLFTSSILLVALLCQDLLPVFAIPLRRHLTVEQKAEDTDGRSSQSAGIGTRTGGESSNLMQSRTSASTPAVRTTREDGEMHSYISSTAKTKPSSTTEKEDMRPTSRVHVQQLNFTRKNPWPENNFSVYIGKPAWI
jgi:hypothetical protein